MGEFQNNRFQYWYDLILDDLVVPPFYDTPIHTYMVTTFKYEQVF